MFYRSDELAIPTGTAPPTDLPGEFHNRIKVHEIVDDEFLGYVNLQLCYILTECIDDGKYNAVECERKVMEYEIDEERHGPAFVTSWESDISDDIYGSVFGRLAGSSYSRDDVYCMRCLSWPSQAADWPTRHRNYGWPDPTTVDRDVVMLFVWQNVCVDGMIRIYSIDYHSHEQKLNCRTAGRKNNRLSIICYELSSR